MIGADRARLIRGISVGLAFGLVGVLADTAVYYGFGCYSVIGLRDAATVCAAFFFGVVPGLVSGVVCAVGRALLPIFGEGICAFLQGPVASLSTTAMALVATRWIFFGKRPSLGPAALFGAFTGACHVGAVFLLGLDDVGRTLLSVSESMPWNLSIPALGGVVGALVCRVPRQPRSDLTACVSALGLAAVCSGVFWAQGRSSVTCAYEASKAYVCDILSSIDSLVESDMLRFSELLVRRAKTAEACAAEDLAAIAAASSLDVVSVVGPNGRILASSSADAVGVDLTRQAGLERFLALTNGMCRWWTEPFSTPRRELGESGELWLKRTGLAFPGGGFVFVGESFRNATSRFYCFEDVFRDWHIGETGSIFLVDPEHDRIVSGQKRSLCRHTASAGGFLDLAFPAPDAFARGRVLNWDDRQNRETFCDAFVRRVDFPYVGYTAYVVLPTEDVFYPRNLTFFLTLLVLVLVYAFGAALVEHIRRQSAALDAMRAAEDLRRKRDLDLAQNIQLSALPSVFTPFPESNELDLYATMRTAKEVGGDFFDFYPIGPRRLALVVADVSDKGVPAALFMMKAKGILKAAAISEPDLAAAMGSANDALSQNNDAGMFVTAWLGAFDLDTGVLEYVSAGHNPPCVRREDGTVEALSEKAGLVLACMSGVSYRVRQTTLKAGDRLVLYTDGVTEAKSAAGAFFGEARLGRTVAACAASARETCERIVTDVDVFAAGAPQADDITVFTMLWRGRAPVQTRTFPATLEGLADASGFLKRTLETAECVAKTKSALMVAMDEIASNIVRYSGAPDFTVRIALETNPPVVRLVFSDAGKPYNPLERADPDVTLAAAERDIGGLGLFMVRKMMDDVEYAHVEGRNVLTLGKRRF